MSEILLETVDLTKKFGSHVSSDNINIHVNKGEIYGLVGRNGAGKTTLMKMICNIYVPTDGKILFANKEQTPACHQQVGALIEEPALMPNLSAYDNILAKCFLMNVDNPKQHAKELLEMVKLSNTKKKHVSHFSLGMRQRVGIALALVGWPEFVLLDEPINGLDPQGIAEIRDIIINLNKEKGITFLISSHLLAELQRVAHRFGIISQGKLVKELDEDDIQNLENEDIRIKTDDMKKTIEVLNKWEPTKTGEYIHIKYSDDEDMYKINKCLVDNGLSVKELKISHQSGEDIFLGLMGGEHYV